MHCGKCSKAKRYSAHSAEPRVPVQLPIMNRSGLLVSLSLPGVLGAILFLVFAAFPFRSFAAEAAVTITEIMYDVPGADNGREWVEITNLSDSPVDVRGYTFFEANTNHGLKLISGSGILQQGDSAIIANDAAKFKIDWPNYSGILFDSTFSLSNTGESLALKDSTLATVNSVTYDASLGAAGNGTALAWNGNAFIAAPPTPGTYAGSVPPSPTITRTVSVTPIPPALSADRQPSLSPTSYRKVQTVESITSTKTNTQTHEEEVIAPAAVTDVPAAGAELLPAGANHASGPLHSPWTFGLLVIIVGAGAAFILL